MKALLALVLLVAYGQFVQGQLRVAISGLVHGHVSGFLNGNIDRDDWLLVGVSEEDPDVLQRYANQYNLDPNILFDNVVTMLDESQPQALAVFSNTYDHLNHTVEAAARGVHVMMEKPLAVSNEHARMIHDAVEESGIQCFVNYETTFYDNHHNIKALVEQGILGRPDHMMARDGHQGPKEIGVQPEFLDWLVDPVRGGGGASFDFGCYGANLFTWILNNERPASVQATIGLFKTDEDYAGSDDHAFATLNYKSGAVGSIQASWIWAYNLKEFDVYGPLGSFRTLGTQNVRVRMFDDPIDRVVPAPSTEFTNSLSLLIRYAQDGQEIDALSSLENNMIVTEILVAMRESRECGGCTIYLEE